MPTKKEVVRDYKIDDANLITVSNARAAFLRRDIASLSAFGITTATISAFEAQINAFENCPNDVELLAEQKYATEFKDAKAAAIRDAIEPIDTRVKIKFANSPAKANSFAVNDLSQFDDANLLRAARRVVRMANVYLPQLASTGLTAAMITQLGTLASEFEVLITNQEEKIAKRDEAQEDRVEMGNALFYELKKLCRLAKSAWRTTDAAKFNDYLLYNNPSGTPTEGEPPIEDDVL